MPARKGHIKMECISLSMDSHTKRIIEIFAEKRKISISSLLRTMIKKQIEDMYLEIGSKIDD